MDVNSSIKEWFSPQELAGLAGMPATDRRVRSKAESNCWLSKKKEFGKGLEYHISSLPDETQHHLRQVHATTATQEYMKDQLVREGMDLGASDKKQQDENLQNERAVREKGLAKFAALPLESAKRKRAKAREFILKAVIHFHRQYGGAFGDACVAYADKVNSGDISLPANVWEWMPTKSGIPHLTEPTMRRWYYDWKAQGIWGLVDNLGCRKGQHKVAQHPELKRLVVGTMLAQPHINGKKMKAYADVKLPDLPSISAKAYQRFMDDWKSENAQLWLYETNPGAWKNKMQVAFGSHFENIERFNQLWELDSTPGDWMLKDGRHSVIGCIDMFSRDFNLFVHKTSNAWAVCQVFRKSLLAWGVCEAIRTDNGKDYTSEQFMGVVEALDIEQELCEPFQSEGKGTIERHFRTMSHGILELLPGFIGHNVSERKVIEERKSFADRVMKKGEVIEVDLTSAELQEILDKWLQVYRHTAHDGLSGKTPWEVVNAWREPVRRISDERALDILLAPVADMRTVTKKGIQFENHYYDAPELALLMGEQILLRYDEADTGRLYAFHDGRFVAVVECPELLGISRKERAIAASHAQKKFLSSQRKEYKDFKKGIDKNIAEVVINHKIEQSKNIESLPKRSTEYTSSGLVEAGKAASADATRQAQTTPFSNRVAPVIPMPEKEESARERYLRWKAIDQKISSGEGVSQEHRKWHQSYGADPQCRVQKRIDEEFFQSGSGY